jgi:hypothetical protein
MASFGEKALPQDAFFKAKEATVILIKEYITDNHLGPLGNERRERTWDLVQAKTEDRYDQRTPMIQ